jgi:hypothetical protein
VTVVDGVGAGRPRANSAAANRPDAWQAVLDAAGELCTGVGYATTTRVRPSPALAARLVAGKASAAVRLWALACADIGLLGSARNNLGALHLLPEVNSPGLVGFRAARAQPKAAYGKLLAVAGVIPAAVRTDLVSGLVESIAVIRRDRPRLGVEAHTREGADGVVRLPGPADRLRTEARALLTALAE